MPEGLKKGIKILSQKPVLGLKFDHRTCINIIQQWKPLRHHVWSQSPYTSPAFSNMKSHVNIFNNWKAESCPWINASNTLCKESCSKMTRFLDMTANPENITTDQKNLLSPSCNVLSTLHLILCVCVCVCVCVWGGGALTKNNFFFFLFFPGKASPLCFQYLEFAYNLTDTTFIAKDICLKDN